jgi:putative FmdB family regulatory protein
VPTYDYVCTVCGHGEEVVHGIHAHGPTVCPVCGGPMRKAFAAPAVHFKGSGWAKKDRKAAASTKAAAKSGAGGEGTSDKATDSTSGSDSTGGSDSTSGSDSGAKHERGTKHESSTKDGSRERPESGGSEKAPPGGEPASRAATNSERTSRTPSGEAD